jgi:plastocyanin
MIRRLLLAAAILAMLFIAHQDAVAGGPLKDQKKTDQKTRAASKPRTHTVTMEATGFQPPSLTIKAGDSVVWVNKDPFPHTATSTAAGFDSGPIMPEKSWTYKSPRTKKGEFPYACSLHPTMKATLKIE